MDNRVLTNKLQRLVIFIFLKHPYDSLRHWHSQFHSFCVFEINFVRCLKTILIISSCVDRYFIVFSNGDCEYFGNKLYLFLRRLIEGDWLRESVHMIITKRLLTKWGSCIHHSYCCSWCIIHRSIHRRFNNINLSCNQLQFSILILLSTIVIDWNPAPEICFGLLLVNDNYIISLPFEPICSVCKLTLLSLINLTIYFPI